MDKWDERFMQLAETVAGWSSCFQENRHVGAVVVKDKKGNKVEIVFPIPVGPRITKVILES